jgi:hypothetical protein
MGFHKVPQGSVGFHDVLVNQGVSTEDNRGLTSHSEPGACQEEELSDLVGFHDIDDVCDVVH